MYWYEKEARNFGPVLSTRVRFARNLENTPFPQRLTGESREMVFRQVKEAFEEKEILAVPFDDLDAVVKEAYVQTHLASTQLVKSGKGSGLILSKNGDVAVMVNEEDHLRLQVIEPGKEIRNTFETAKNWAEFGEKKLSFAFREGLGYLTSCPTNLGAALRVSVMIHLPALTAVGGIAPLTRSLNDAGFTVRGLFGEGSRESGGIYQISNQMSREKLPEEIVSSFEKVIAQVEEREEKARVALLNRDRLEVEDRVSRALGAMKYAKKMDYSEFITLYSQVRFGKEAGLEEVAQVRGLDRLLIELMPAPMVLRDRTLVDERARDARRSEILRERMKE